MKIIEPLSKDIKPEADPIAKRRVPLPTSPVAEPQSLPHRASIRDWELSSKDAEDSRWTYAPYLFVFGAIAGAFYYLLYDFVVSHVPRAANLCIHAGLVSATCSGTLLGSVITATLLFMFVGGISSLILHKSFLLPFFVGSLSVALFFFLEFAMVNDLYLAPAVTWLFTQHILNDWVIPAVLAGIVVAGVNAAIFYLKKRTKVFVGAVIVSISALLILFLPSASLDFAAKQTEAAIQSDRDKLITEMQKSDIPLYAPKNINGPLKPTSLSTSIGNIYFAPAYEVNYSFSDPYPNQTGATKLLIRKVTATQFNPPADCGTNSLPQTGETRASPSPCILFVTTPKGRQVYGYVPSWKFGQLHIDQNSAEAKTIPPDTYYVLIDGIVISFNGPTADGRSDNIRTKTPLTAAVIEQFVDSLDALHGDDLAQFARTYLTNK